MIRPMNLVPKDDWISVAPTELNVTELVTWATRPDCGAIVTFSGTVRSHSEAHDQITALDYETSVELANRNLVELVRIMRGRWPELGAVAVHHRIGRVELGETSVIVVASAPHRDVAFEATRFCIDTLKESLPMWKRELWEGGSAWSPQSRPLIALPEQ
jgi:molybdopterin synthase catalytic subunit